ncbi:MAG: MFS transporter [Ruthenibacterium sp.]
MKLKHVPHFGKDFTLVVIGQIISLFGNAILRFALPLYLLRETNSPALFGLVSACSLVPMILLSFLGGVLADRVNKRNIMVFLDFCTAGIVFTLQLSLGKIPLVFHFIVILMLLYGISGTYQPVVQASIPALVPRENVLSASAIVNQVSALASLLGPIFGGILFGAFGLTPILILSTLCFAASAVMEIFIHIPFTPRDNSSGICAIVKSDFRDSAHYMRHEKPILLKIIIFAALLNLVLSSMVSIGIPVIVVQTLRMSDELLGISQGFLAFGGLCGGILTAVFSKKLKLKNAHFLLLFCSLSVGIMALPPLLHLPNIFQYCILTAACFALMLFATMFSVQMIAAVQTETPPELVGKVIALMMSIAMGAQPVGQAIYGVLFDVLSAHIGILLLCVCILSVLISLAVKKIFQAMA